MEGAVFVQTNAAHNEVIAFARDAAGTLTHLGTFATGGAGSDEAHLPSQGSVTLTGDRRHLLVTNVASDDLSVFSLEGAMPALTKTAPTVRLHGVSRSAMGSCSCSSLATRGSTDSASSTAISCRSKARRGRSRPPTARRSASRPTVAHSSRPSAAATGSPPSRSAWTGCSGSHARSTRSVQRRTGSPSHRTGHSSSPRPSAPRRGRPQRRVTAWTATRSRRVPRAWVTVAARSAGQ